MRTTLDIDDVVLSAARAKARAEGISLGRAISDLVLRSLSGSTDETHAASSSGFPVLKGMPGHVVTDEMVAAYRDEE